MLIVYQIVPLASGADLKKEKKECLTEERLPAWVTSGDGGECSLVVTNGQAVMRIPCGSYAAS